MSVTQWATIGFAGGLFFFLWLMSIITEVYVDNEEKTQFGVTLYTLGVAVFSAVVAFLILADAKF